jgi:hypothetical protein
MDVIRRGKDLLAEVWIPESQEKPRPRHRRGLPRLHGVMEKQMAHQPGGLLYEIDGWSSHGLRELETAKSTATQGFRFLR